MSVIGLSASSRVDAGLALVSMDPYKLCHSEECDPIPVAVFSGTVTLHLSLYEEIGLNISSANF
jgi:hypothetical protein